MKNKDFARILKDEGFSPQRQSGSHLIWSDGKRNVSVPQGSNVNRMLARRLIKEIGYKGNIPELRYWGNKETV